MYTCKRFNGNIERKRDPDLMYLDQLSESDNIWILAHKFSRYIKSTYNIDLHQYYNIVVYNDINYEPICPSCGINVLTFNRFNRGYNKTCSKSCSNRYLYNTNESYRDRILSGLKRGNTTQWNSDNTEYYRKLRSIQTTTSNLQRVNEGTHNFLTENGGAEASRERQNSIIKTGLHPFQTRTAKMSESAREYQLNLIESGDHPFQKFESKCVADKSLQFSNIHGEIIYLYISDIIDVTSHFKIGVTLNPELRLLGGSRNLVNLTAICIGNKCDILNLECDLKLKFADREKFNSDRVTEYYKISDKNDILNYINNYLSSNSTTIEKLI